jgi:hypothetical protein
MLTRLQDVAVSELCRQGHQREAAEAMYHYERDELMHLIPLHDYSRPVRYAVLRANDELEVARR